MASSDSNHIAKEAREHAWAWFSLHAAQRMQAFNFFLVATAFLIAGYASLVEKHRSAAIAVALLGAWLTFWFTRLDGRSRQLVKAGERALAVIEAQLAATTGIEDLRIVEAVEQPDPGTSSYRRVIKVIQWTLFGVFLLGAGYATLAERPVDVVSVEKTLNSGPATRATPPVTPR
jgi:hypothetical protein